MIGDSIWPGHHRIAGEWGHNVLDPDGEPCYCGKRGCVETVISGPATERHYRRLTGKDKSLKEIALEEDDAARETIDRLCLMFGRALSVVVNILDPDVIVVGGGVGNVKRLYSDGRSALGKAVFNDGFDARLVAPELGDSAGVFGACMLTR